MLRIDIPIDALRTTIALYFPCIVPVFTPLSTLSWLPPIWRGETPVAVKPTLHKQHCSGHDHCTRASKGAVTAACIFEIGIAAREKAKSRASGGALQYTESFHFSC